MEGLYHETTDHFTQTPVHHTYGTESQELGEQALVLCCGTESLASPMGPTNDRHLWGLAGIRAPIRGRKQSGYPFPHDLCQRLGFRAISSPFI